MKIISKNYWQDVKNFVQQISIKFGGVYLRWIWFKLCCRQAHQNIDKNIGENSHIGRYSKGQISADNIGRPL